MPVADESFEIEYTSNGVNTNYVFSFKYIKPSDVVVRVSDVIVSDYSLGDFGLANGGIIKFNTAPANEAAILIKRETPLEQEKQFFGPTVSGVTEVLDKLMVIQQETTKKVDDAIEKSTNLQLATTTSDGLMSAPDKGKLDLLSGATGLNPATTTSDGLMTAPDKVKLNGVATGATANSTDVQLRDRTTHTGVQPISSVSGLQTNLDLLLASNVKIIYSDTFVMVDGAYTTQQTLKTVEDRTTDVGDFTYLAYAQNSFWSSVSGSDNWWILSVISHINDVDAHTLQSYAGASNSAINTYNTCNVHHTRQVTKAANDVIKFAVRFKRERPSSGASTTNFFGTPTSFTVLRIQRNSNTQIGTIV